MVDSSMLIHCPTCATSYDVKPSSLGAAGRSVRCVRCRTVWFATARPPEPVAATGQRTASASSNQNAAAASTHSADVDEQIRPNTGDSEAQEFGAAMSMSSPAGDELVGGMVQTEPMLDPGARALGMETETPAGAFDSYEPITMADAPPLAPMDHDASKIPAELPMLTGVANRVDAFVPRRTLHAGRPASRPIPVPGLPPLILALAAIIVGLLGWRTNVVQAAPQMASLYAMIGLPVNVRGLVFEDIKTTQETQDGTVVLAVEGAIANVAKGALDVPRLRFAVVNSSGNEVYAWTAQPARLALPNGAKLPFRSLLASPPADGREVVVRFYSRRDAAAGLR